MHSNESGATSWPGECMPSTIKPRRPFRLASNPWAADLGGAPQGYAPLAVPHARYVGPDCPAQSCPQAVSSSPTTLQGGLPYSAWSAPPPCALQEDARRVTAVLKPHRSPEPFHAATTMSSFVRPSASPTAAYNLPRTSPVSYEEAGRIAWAQPCPTGVSDRGDSTQSESYPLPHLKSVDEILPTIRAEAKARGGVRGFPGIVGSSKAEGCGLLEDVGRMANDRQMDLIPLDQMSPRSVDTTAAEGGETYVERAASSNIGAAEEGYFNSENAANLMILDGYAEGGQPFGGEECNDSSGSSSGPPHKVSPIPAAAWYRKLCEISGCNIQPSYGERGTSRPLFCARHKKEGMVGLKNRPCLYPGCSTRPHYGLPGGRAFYCTSHKKDGMVHLLKEITIRAKLEKESKLVEAGGVLIKRKRCPYGTGSYARRTRAVEIAAEARHASVFGNEGDEAEPESESVGAAGGNASTGGDEGFFSRGARIAKGGMSGSPALTVTVSPSSPTPSSSRSSSIPLTDDGLRSTAEMREVGLATPPSAGSAQSERTPRPTITSRNPHRAFTGLVSWESALDEVGRVHDAGGTGRRARAPSRKAMEAAGKAEGEGVQWMTKEKREEQARLSEKLKRQRKAAAAAGLKAGQVLEEYDVPATPVDAGAPGPGEEPDASCDGGSDKTRGARKGPQGVRSGRKANTTESTLQGTKTKHPVNVATRHHPARHGAAPAVASKSCAGALSSDRNDGTDAGARDPATRGSMVARGDAPSGSKGKRSAGKKKRDAQAEQAGKGGSSRGARGYRSRAGLGKAGAGGRHEAAKETKCEFQTCSKMANFGVNLTVRYCELHRLFGMHEIADNPSRK